MKRTHFFLIGLLLLAGLLFLGGRAIAGSKTPAQREIDSLQTQAAGAGNPDAQALLRQKIEPLSAAEAARATAQANAPEKSGDLCGLVPPVDPNATPAPTIAIPRGISDWLQPPFSTQDVHVVNQWNDQLDGAWLTAYAGALGQDPRQGIVIVVDRQGGYFRFLLGENSGEARFTAAEGTLVTVETGAGLRFKLDMASLELTGEDGRVLAATPQAPPATLPGTGGCR